MIVAARRKRRKRQSVTHDAVKEKNLHTTLMVIALFLLLAVAIFVYHTITTKDTPTETSLANEAMEEEAHVPENEANERKITVEEGDQVTIDYLGRLEDGSVFDTSNEDYAKKYGLYNENKQYGALTVTVGKGQLIRGFEQGLLGMTLDQQKRITVAPEDGYGQPDLSKLQEISRVKEIPRVQELNLLFNVTFGQFAAVFHKEPIKNDVVTGDISPWPYRVVAIQGNIVYIRAVINQGRQYVIPKTPWNSTAIVVTDVTARLRQDPTQESVQTELGMATITVTGNKLIFFLTPNVGDVVATKEGRGIVKSIEEDRIIIDNNHPLAGKTLIFDVVVQHLVKKF